MLHAKKKECRLAKRNGSNAAYKEACHKSRASIRQFKRNQEQRILYSKNSKQFFSYVRHKLENNNCQIDLNMGRANVSCREAAEIFVSEFSSNFSSTVCVDKAVYTPYLKQSKPILSLLNCTEFVVMEALKSCNYSSSSPDGISFKLLKQ